MANAFRCDRCEAFDLGEPAAQILKVEEPHAMEPKPLQEDNLIDLCVECSEHFDKWKGYSEVAKWEDDK